MSDFGGPHRYNVTGLHHNIWGFPTQNPEVVQLLNHHLYDKIENRSSLLARWKEYKMEGAETVVIAYGSAARSAMQHATAVCAAKGSAFWSCRLSGLSRSSLSARRRHTPRASSWPR